MEEIQAIAVPKKSKIKSFFYAIWKFIKFVVVGFFKIIAKFFVFLWKAIWFYTQYTIEMHSVIDDD